MALTRRSSSLEYIELIPDSTPPPLDSSVSSTSTAVQRESQITTDQYERLEPEAGGEVNDESGPRHLDDRGPIVPPGAAGGSAVAAAASDGDDGGEKERPSSTSRRHPSSLKQPFERGKSLLEVSVNQPSSPTPSGFERGMSPEELTSTLRREVGMRYLHHRGSVRANFTSPGGSAFLTRWAQWLNKMGKEKREYSLLCFHKKGRTRRFCKKIVKSKIFKLFMALVAILNSMSLLFFYQPVQNNDTKMVNDIIAYTSLIFIAIYVMEVVLGVIAYTCILHPKGYLRRGWTTLDLAVILFGILYVSLYTRAPVLAEVFASLMTLKLINILSFFDSVQFILKVLVKLFLPLLYLSLFTVLVMIFFALVGMQLFSGNLHGGCFASYRTPAGNIEDIRVSQYPCKLENMASLDVGVHHCPNDSTCKPWRVGPNSGLTSFDDIFVAFLTVFQVMTLEGWTGIFYLYESAVGTTYAWVYFLLVVVVGSVFILNLWIGVLTSVFIGVSDREESHGNIRKLKEKKRNDDDLKNYKEWLKRATELDLPSETGSIGRRPSITGGVHWTTVESLDSGSESDDEIGSIPPPPLDDKSRSSFQRKWYKSRVVLRAVLKSKAFDFFDLSVHAVNLVFLMSLHFPPFHPSYDFALGVLNHLFSVWYVTEVCLRMHAYGIKAFFTRRPALGITLFSLMFLSIVSLLWYIPSPFFSRFDLSFLVNAVWSVKLIQVLRYTSYWKAMKEIINTFFQLLNQMLSLVGILGVFTLMFTIMGIRLFGERIRFQEEEYPSFDNWYKSFFLVFQLLTTEDWHNVFYSYIGPYRRENRWIAGLVAMYYGAVLVIGSFILISVFLAIAVDKLSEVRSLEEDTMEETEKLRERRKEREEQICALKNPNQPQVQRRTIRRVMRYLADNPSERLKQLHNVEAQRKRKRKQLTFRDLKRGTSLINPPGTVLSRHASDYSYRRSTSDSAANTPITLKESEAEAVRKTVSAQSDAPMASQGQGQGQGSARPSVISLASSVSSSAPKQRNPLRLMKRRSDYFDRQKLRLGGWQASAGSSIGTGSAAQSTRSSFESSVVEESQASGSVDRRISQGQATTMSVDEEDSVFGSDGAAHSRETERLFSVASTPESGGRGVKDCHPLTVSYERTQSSPGDISSPTEYSLSGRAAKLEVIEELRTPDLDRELHGDESGRSSSETDERRQRMMKKQDTMDDGDGIEDTFAISRTAAASAGQAGDGSEHAGGARQFCRSFSPSNLQLPADLISAQRLDRESSLEAIPQQSGTERRASQVALSAKVTLKKKLLQVWDWIKDYSGTIVFNPAKELKEIPNHSSFFALAPDNRLRQFCFRLACSQSFETISYTVILLSSILLALEIPVGVQEDSQLCSFQRTLIFLDGVIVLYFLLEMFLKVIALGLILHRGSYLRSFFNILDSFVVISSLIPILYYITRTPPTTDRCFAHLYEPGALPLEISILRIFRVLRPFRAVRLSGLYLVVTGLISSIKSMGSVLLVTLLALLVFAVIGVNIFRGRFYFCTDPAITTEEDCHGCYFDYEYGFDDRIPDLSCPEVRKRVWGKRDFNFANVGNALLTLLTMITGEGWQNVMYSGINSVPPVNAVTPVGAQPYASPQASIYFIVYMTLMTFVLLQLFIGVVIVAFQAVGVKSFRETKLDRNQRNCLYFALTAKPVPQYAPTLGCHRKFHDRLVPILNHWIFKAVILFALIANCVLLALQEHEFSEDGHVSDSATRYQVIYYLNIVFTAFFVVEALLKIIVFTPPIYFRSIWNVFEFLVEFFAVLELIIVNSLTNHIFNTDELSLKMTMIASTFRVLRLFRFIPQVRLILWTVFQSLEIFPWVGYLLMMVIFFFTVLGMQLFGTIRIAPIDDPDGSEINDYNNFSNFFRAFLVMIRVTTGENWPDVMLDCLGGQTCEVQSPGTDGCGDNFAYVFFILYYVLTTILILNLFVAIIIDNFDYIVRDRSILGAHQLGLFIKLWSTFDPSATGKVSPEVVLELMRKCNPPVGWGKLCPQTVAYKKMMNLNMPLVDGKVTFNATLFALVRTALKVQCQGCPECSTRCNIDLKKKLLILFPTMAEKQISGVLAKEDDETVGKKYAALLIQHIWRSRAARTRKVKEIFQGSQGTIRLRTGPRAIPDTGPDLVGHRTADFAADLALPSPTLVRRPSELSSVSTTESPLLRGPLSPSSLTGFEFGGMAALSDHPSQFQWKRVTSTTQVQQLPQLPETVEEHHQENAPDDDDNDDDDHTSVGPVDGEGGRGLLPQLEWEGELEEDDDQLRQIEEDLQSELSFASAYSHPRESPKSLERMETTV